MPAEKKYILAFDQGTTSSKAFLFDMRGKIVGYAGKDFDQIYPRPGWVEHDPDEIWTSQLLAAHRAMAAAGADADQIAAIGITNQRETTIIWDRSTGKPVYNAIVWQCRRTADRCEQLKKEKFDALIRAKTGLVTDAYFSGTKAEWILDNVPGARARAEKGDLLFGTVDTWLIHKLTGGTVHATDLSNASRTMLFDIHSLRWDDEILSRLSIPKSILPKVCGSSEVVGMTVKDLLGAEIPIAGNAGDQQAALFGQTCYRAGKAKNTYGTGCFMLLNTGECAIESKDLLTTIAWGVDGSVAYALEGSVFIAGAAVQWLRDGLNILVNSSEIEKLAGSVADTGGVYFVPAFVGLGAPHWDPFARGTIVGLTRGTTRAHLARATLEAIAYQTGDVLAAMKRDSGVSLEVLAVDGGAAVNNLLCQFQADILGVPVERPAVSETTALGAAYLAGMAIGFWSGTDEICRNHRIERRFEPAMGEGERARLCTGWSRALERARGWAAD